MKKSKSCIVTRNILHLTIDTFLDVVIKRIFYYYLLVAN